MAQSKVTGRSSAIGGKSQNRRDRRRWKADHTDIHTPRIHHFGRKTWGIILAAALAGALLWATGIGVSGRKTLEYKQDVREGKSSDIAWDNEEANYIESRQ